MVHLPEDRLQNKITEAKKQVVIGAIYQHYRDHQLRYQILTIGLFEGTDEVCVIYQAQYGERLVWVRSLAKWNEEVNYQGKKIKRFQKV